MHHFIYKMAVMILAIHVTCLFINIPLETLSEATISLCGRESVVEHENVCGDLIHR